MAARAPWRRRADLAGPAALGLSVLLRCGLQLVLDLAGGVLGLAAQLLGRALGLQRLVAGQLAGGFLDRAPRFAGGALEAVVVHWLASSCCASEVRLSLIHIS